MHTRIRPLPPLLAPALLCAFATPAAAQLVIDDTLNGASSAYNWQALGGACLTAGSNTGSIPACVGLPYYAGKVLVGGTSGLLAPNGDPPGRGALRLTNGDLGTSPGAGNGAQQTGAIVSGFTFPSSQGVQVTFTTATYGGNGYTNPGGGNSGADGMTFFLMDADAAGPGYPRTLSRAGGQGGSLGYSCSNGNTAGPEGLPYAYLGVGMDEFGNFANPGDNTATGPGTGPGQGSVVVRGAGNITWNALHGAHPVSYPASLDDVSRRSAVMATCRTGTYWNFSNGPITDANGRRVPSGQATSEAVMDYPYIASSAFPSGTTLYSQELASPPTRGHATPVTYSLSINTQGQLNLSYSINGGVFNPVLSNLSIAQNNGPVPANFYFGFAAGTGRGSNVHEILCFKAAPTELAQSSGSVNVLQSAQVRVGSQLYLAYYHPTNWWGQLTAQNLLLDPLTQNLTVATLANWDASCVLTGGSCASSGISSVTAQAASDRTILSFSGVAGIPFEWGALSGAQQASLDPASAGKGGSPILDYLRGQRGTESAQGGPLRTRTSVLGDIVNSSPTWVGPPLSPYQGPLQDALYKTPLPEGDSYKAYATRMATRTNVVYVGANDGMLHGFRAGAYTAAGDFNVNAPNDGRELLAYVPAAIVQNLRTSNPALDYTSPAYAHNALVDATPGVGDLYYAGRWHTWLVGGLGGGGNARGVIGDNTTPASGAIYALDITDPSQFSVSNAASLVLGEWSAANLACVNDTASAPCRRALGNTYGTPIIRRLHDGNWAAIFGNGYNSPAGRAGVYVLEADAATGRLSLRYLDTGWAPPAGLLNGIAQVSSADLDGDHVTDYLYAGDLAGNVWRFDLTSSAPADWAARRQPVFQTGGLPITTHVSVAIVGSNAAPRVMLDFGTGQVLAQTLTSAARPASSATQSLFGVWDWDLTAWNLRSSSSPVAALPLSTAGVPPGHTLKPDALQAQVLNTYAQVTGSNYSGVRTLSSQPVCWAGTTTCGAGASNTQFGWRVALDNASAGAPEQIIYNPQLQDGLLLFNTTVPGMTQALSCQAQPATGYTLALRPDTGGAPALTYFRDGSGSMASPDGNPVSGIGMSAVGTPSFVIAGSRKYLVAQTASGAGTALQVNAGSASSGRRLTWQKLR